MATTMILTDTHNNRKISTNIELYDFNILKTTPTTQERTKTHNNSADVAWDTLFHQKLTMDSNITALTRQY